MADAVRTEGQVTAPAPAPLTTTRPPARRGLTVPSGVQRRFLLAYLLLAIVLGAAAGLAVVLLTRSSSHAASPQAKSLSFRPTGVGIYALRQIAEHVGVEYRLPSGHQLVAVIPRTSMLPGDVQLSTIVLHTGFPVENPKDFAVYDFQRGAMYVLCGGGANCSISEGQPSTARGVLLSREALELALRTLRDVPEVESVIVFVPPKPGSTDKRMLFFRRSELAPELQRPLDATLLQVPRLVPGSLSGRAASIVEKLTETRLFLLKQAPQLPDGTLAFISAPPQLGS